MYSKSILVPRSCQENILLCLLWLGFPLLTMVSFLWYRKQQWMEVGCKCNVTSEPECRTIKIQNIRQTAVWIWTEQVGWAIDLEIQYWMSIFPRKLLLTVEGLDGSVRKSVWWKNHATTPTKHFEWNYCSQDHNIPLQLMFSFHPLIDSMPTIFGIFGIRIVSS